VQILYDGLIFSSDKTGGIRRYFTNLVSKMPESVEPWVTTTHAAGAQFPRHPSLQVRRFPRFRPQKLSSIAERVYFRSISRRGAFDLAHPTYYYLLSRQRLRDYRCPSVITVHDMISELFPLRTRAGEIETLRKRQAVADAARVVCVSENTKRDLIRLFGTKEAKISVVYEGSELNLAMAGGEEPVPERPYFLYVGGHEAAYKNFHRLLQSMAKVVARHSDVLLAIAGPSLTPAQLATAESLGLAQHVVHFGGVSDAHLAKLYNRSVALVYPSLYEGFGIPPLEAMACETAVIASNRSSIPEVVGDAALLVDPESEDDLTAGIISVLEDSGRRQDLIRRGREREKLFNWDKMAGEIYEIYQEVIGADM
jgi:glycosyltransferase involved in cell wall biosynthesis